MKFGTAESFTSGALARKFTSVQVQASILKLDSSILSQTEAKSSGCTRWFNENHGIVSLEVAENMALGGAETLGVDICLSSTGVAGPGGGTVDIPVGTVCLAIAKNGSVRSWKKQFEGSREEVVEKSVDFLFSRLADVLDETEKSRLFALLKF